MTGDEIVLRVRTRYPDAVVAVAGKDCSFEIQVITEAFTGQNTLQRQKPILGLFKDEIRSGALHALSVKANTPDEQASQTALIQIG